MMAELGFLPPTDPRLAGTVAAVERHLSEDGFVRRYSAGATSTGSRTARERSFPARCGSRTTNALMGRFAEARRIFERVLDIRNDLGLLAEEYDPRAGRLLGNFPQAFSQVGLVNTAVNLSRASGPAEDRKRRGDDGGKVS
jgi:GH15 family glucan-1,4-alpha-glucosidase